MNITGPPPKFYGTRDILRDLLQLSLLLFTTRTLELRTIEDLPIGHMAAKPKNRMGAGTEHSTDLRLELTAATTESALPTVVTTRLGMPRGRLCSNARPASRRDAR